MTAPDAELADWLRLALTPGIGGETQRSLLAAFGLPAHVFASSLSALRGVVGAPRAERLLHSDAGIETQIATALAWATEPGNHILTLADAEYPQALLASADPPILLYAKGRCELLNRPALAIVGSRNATPQGEANAAAFAASFAAAGLTVVSGMALGIDRAAHQGALTAKGEAAGSTIAVIGTGADRIYPARNRELARQIAVEGLIISEFPLDTPALSGNFPRRNRIIAGLAQGCLVVEAAARSGSLITARLAAEAGREVFAIPGSIHSPLAKGCHQLIKQGAKLVESAQDVLEELAWQTQAAPVAVSPAAVPETGSLPEDGADAAATANLLDCLGYDPCALDVLAERSGLTADALLAMLLRLELDGRIASLPGGRYQRLTK
ncbi:DNA protecting protein DprA [Sterolibacterium denitrificans]|uniref:DNA protecting protein DprA n=1 Tax=Sterolibacterium denitrificans TaxID=157592 RepID=A0A7Z7HPE9_9PROT|nr:DNA-processing protein DprA [Sterolibacterium denitrificans]SMB22064.1 DNA protecting protein DprA [Sterolibacterium denitrificans]